MVYRKYFNITIYCINSTATTLQKETGYYTNSSSSSKADAVSLQPIQSSLFPALLFVSIWLRRLTICITSSVGVSRDLHLPRNFPSDMFLMLSLIMWPKWLIFQQDYSSNLIFLHTENMPCPLNSHKLYESAPWWHFRCIQLVAKTLLAASCTRLPKSFFQTY